MEGGINTRKEVYLVDPVTKKKVNVEQNGGLAVNIQDQHSTALDLYFIKAIGAPTTLLADANSEDTTITLTSTTGFTNGVTVGIFTAEGSFYFGRQIGAPAGSDISLDTPIDKAFLSGSSVIAANRSMNVNGSVTTQVFQIGPVGGTTGVEIDITRIMGYLQDNVDMDDSKFGGISALTKGIVLRQNNGIISNIWNAKTNGELSLLSYDFTYTDKAPAGSYGARFRNSYAGQDKHGVTLRLEPGDILEILVQDDLTGLQDFTMMAQGHVVTD